MAINASFGSIENLETLLARSGGFCVPRPGEDLRSLDACAVAAKHGHMHVVRWLLDKNYPLHRDTVFGAALQHCDMEDAQWLLQQPAFQGYSPSAAVVSDVARCTLPDATTRLAWLLDELRCPLEEAAVKAAADAGLLPTLQWFLDVRGFEEDPAELLCEAASTETISWLLARHPYSTRGLYVVCKGASSTGQLEMLALLWPLVLTGLPNWTSKVKYASPLPDGTLDWAPVERLLLKELLEDAGREGQHRTASYLWDQGARVHNLGAFVEKAGMAMCTWLHARGALEEQLDIALQNAVEDADLELLAYLVEEVEAMFYEQPVEASEYTKSWLGLAASGSQGHRVKFLNQLEEYGCPLQWEDKFDKCGALALVASQGDVRIMDWLWERGFVDAAFMAGAWMLPLHKPFHTGLLAAAAMSGCEAMAEWVVDHGCPLRGPDPTQTGVRIKFLSGETDDGDEEEEEELGQGAVKKMVAVEREEPRQPWGMGQAYFEAASNTDLDMLRCLRRLGVPWGRDTFMEAVGARDWGSARNWRSARDRWGARNWRSASDWGSDAKCHTVSLSMLRWMVEEGGAPWDGRAYEAARDRPEVRAWMEGAGMASGAAA